MKSVDSSMAVGGGATPDQEDRIWQGEPANGGTGSKLTVSALLRGLGGLVIVAAFVLYLFQGWRDGDDLLRTLILLAHTSALTLAGFASGHLLKEAKGARLLIALALAAVPVNFAFLGGITYDFLTWDQALATGGSLAASMGLWRPEIAGTLDSAGALTLAGAAILVLAVSIWVGFLVMARRSAGALTGLYLLANAALLIPTRGPLVISAVLLALAVSLTWATIRLRRRDASLATPEGVFARGVLILPLLVVGGRSIWLYTPEALFFTTLAVVGYLGLRLVLGSGARGGRMVEWAAVAMAAISALLMLETLDGVPGLSDIWLVPAAAAVLAGMLLDLSFVVSERSRGYRSAAASIIALALCANLGAFGGLGNAGAAVLLGLAGTVWGYHERSRWVFFTSLVTTLLGFAVGAHAALSSFSVGGWTALVLAGIAAITAGSAIERYSERIKSGMLQWNSRFEREERAA